jgi:hypothetical protein
MASEPVHQSTAERIIRRLMSRRVAQTIPPDMVPDRCWYSPTGYALWIAGPDGEPDRCTCRPCLAPKETANAG